jgi:hypothetical protein
MTHRYITTTPAAGARGALALLQTCRQIKDEATPLFFSTITFSLQCCALEEFGKMIGPEKVALVTSLITDLVDAYVWECSKAGLWDRNVIGELSARKNLYLVEPYLQHLSREWVIKKMRVLLDKDDLVVTFGPLK